MPLFVFDCPAGHEQELLRHRDVTVVACSCGQSAARREVNRVGVIGVAPVPVAHRNMRQDFKDFTEARAELGDSYERRKQATGEHIAGPDYAGIAQRRASVMRASGEFDG